MNNQNEKITANTPEELAVLTSPEIGEANGSEIADSELETIAGGNGSGNRNPRRADSLDKYKNGIFY
jgi:hypothetical protein